MQRTKLIEIKLKTFLKALELVHGQPKKVKKYLLDKRLTAAEKKILSCWFLLKSCRHQEILEEMKSLAGENQLVEAQKKLIIGLTLNNMGEIKKASQMLHDALVTIEKYPIPNHHFICVYNLFVISFNLSHQEDMENCLTIMERFSPSLMNERQQTCYLQCQFNFKTFLNQFEEAAFFLSELESKRQNMTEATVMAFLISKFVYYLKRNKMLDSENVLEEMKLFRLFRHSPNFIFMRITLDHLKDDRPLYFYEKDFKDSEVLFNQLKTIQSLEESNFENAERYWKKLQTTDPEMYLSNFQYQGQKNLFSLCLLKHQSKFTKHEMAAPNSKNKVDALIEIISNSKIPVPKDVLFEKLWGRKPIDESDDDKLKNAIYYARKNKGYHIQFRKGCYLISKQLKEKKAS